MLANKNGMVGAGEAAGVTNTPAALRVIKGLFKWLFIVVGTLVLIGVTTLIFMFMFARPYIDSMKKLTYEELTSINNNTFRQLADTVVLGANGDKIGEINILNYDYVSITEVSKYITDGYIAVEDKTFETHNGVDQKAVLRALISLVKNKGSITQGGSTITQQVLKNNLINPDLNKFQRKILELFMAPEFEKIYSKPQIMEFYVNTNFYANNIYGVGQASQYYFGKPCKDLTLAEAAVLVGLSNSPSAYDPVRHPEACLEKRHFILKRMLEEGKITQYQFDQADKEEMVLTLDRDQRTKESYLTSYAIHDATLKLMEKEGFAFQYTFSSEAEYNDYNTRYNELYDSLAAQIRRGGYTIYTQLNTEVQSKVQEAVDNNLYTFKQQSSDGRYEVQGAAVVVDNQTGYVIALVGGRGTDDEYNRAYQAKRQPGSAIKPILVYGPAFDTGDYYPSLKVNDQKQKNGPGNVSGSYHGMTPIRSAIARSVNTIADQVYLDITPEYAIQYLEKLRMNGLSWQDNGIRALALGGFTYGTTVVDMAKAYATIANYGEYTNRTTVTMIELQGEGVVYSEVERQTPVYTEDTAYMLIDCMREAFTDDYGTARGLGVTGVDLAAKTGTTNSKKDGWFCGMSPYYTVAVWVGADQPRRISDLSGGEYPGDIWHDVMDSLHQEKPEKEFRQPSTIIEGYVDYKGKRVDYNSGSSDLFSQIAIDKKEAANAEAERLKNEAEDIALKDELDEKLRSFQGYSIYDMNDIPKYDSSYKSLLSKASKFHSEALASEYKSLIQAEYNSRNNEQDVEDLRAAYNTAMAEQAKRETEEREQRKKDAIAAAEAAVSNLEKVSDYSNFQYMVDNARQAASRLEEFGLADSYYERIDQMEYIYNAYIAPPTPTPSPTEPPVYDWPGDDTTPAPEPSPPDAPVTPPSGGAQPPEGIPTV